MFKRSANALAASNTKTRTFGQCSYYSTKSNNDKQLTLTDSCVKQLQVLFDSRSLNKDQFKMRIKYNPNSRLGPPDHFFITDQIDSGSDTVFEKNGVGVVVDKDTLDVIKNCMIDYKTDEDNIARSTFYIAKKRDWE
jgi:Fe-S cluster assembly iron-binding protein IscA